MTSWNDDLLTNPHAVADKRRRVQQMFAAIAPSYDLNNRLHSLWMDQLWRRKAVKLSKLRPTDQIADIACGTGDLTLRYYSNLWHTRISADSGRKTYERSFDYFPSAGEVIGVDFTLPMLLAAARKRVGWKGGLDWPARADELTRQGLQYINADAQNLPLADASRDIVSIAFGIRNVQSPAAAFAEFFRVLRPGGRVIVLEFSLPTNPILRALYNFYLRHVLPRTATWISRDKTGAYKYLPQSVNTFIGREQMVALLEAAGFTQVEQFPLTFGVCVCYRGVKL